MIIDERPANRADRLHHHAGRYVFEYLAGSVEREGRAALGVSVSGALTGIYRFLAHEVGSEAAFNTMQQAADKVVQECSRPPPA